MRLLCLAALAFALVTAEAQACRGHGHRGHRGGCGSGSCGSGGCSSGGCASGACGQYAPQSCPSCPKGSPGECPGGVCPNPDAPVKPTKPHKSAQTDKDVEIHDALVVVNEYRVSRGLRPFIRCEGLTRGAVSCVLHRERYRIIGHSQNDFAFIPAGYMAQATGAEGPGWVAGMGWGTCCMNDTQYTHAGAAWIRGEDGHSYMSLFVR